MEMKVKDKKGEMKKEKWLAQARRVSLFLIFTFSFLISSSQQLDYRATLNVASMAQSFSLAPDGRLWMATRAGEVFYADSVGGLWHVVQLPDSVKGRFDLLIDHVFTPDSHTIVMSGWIGGPNKHKDGYIISTDSGRTWELRTLGDCDEWVDASWRADYGRIWMGGLTGRLHYSDDHGRTFRVIHNTDTAGDRISAIWLDNTGQQGFLAVLGNKLQITDDGFRTVRRIETPKQQGVLALERQGWYGKIWEAFQWRQWLMVRQESRWFYAHRDTLRWHPCPIDLDSWALSPDGDRLTVQCIHGLVRMQSPTEWSKIADADGKLFADDGNHILLTTFDAIVTVTRDGKVTKYPNLTTDYELEEPYYKVQYDGSMWGYDGNDILMKKGHRWGRVVHTDFRISDLRPADTCLLVESATDVYSITRHRTTPTPMRYSHPLDRFLKAKPVELTIVSSTSGCFHYAIDSVNYRRVSVPSHALASSGDRFRMITMNLHDTVMPIPAHFSFDAEELEKLLADFDRQPDSPLRRIDLGVTAADRAALLADTAEYKEWRGTTPRVLRMVAEGFDTISDSTVAAALTAPEGWWSTTTYTVRFMIVNAAGDTMTLSRRFSYDPPFLLPCHVSLPGRSLYAANLPLMRFLGQQMPEAMLSSHLFKPLAALRRIAEHLDTNR